MKKYSNIYEALVERIRFEERNAKNPDKAAKTRLHQMYGAYVQPNINKKAMALIEKIICSARTRLDLRDISDSNAACRTSPPPADMNIIRLLKLHASTNERLPYYSDFYDFIFSQTGMTDKVLDLGCGFNPFSLPFFPKQPSEYHAIDIDIHTKDLLNAFFAFKRLPEYATCEDLVSVTPTVKVDLALMLKLIPVLEANKPGRAYNLANELNTAWLVVTFPTKSLGGKIKGMATNYRAGFCCALKNKSLSNFSLVAENSIQNELVFVLKHKNQ